MLNTMKASKNGISYSKTAHTHTHTALFSSSLEITSKQEWKTEK